MIIEIPDEIMSSSLSATSKLAVGMVLTYPLASKSQIARELGITSRAVYKAVKEAKIAYEPVFTKCEQVFTKCEPVFTRSSSSNNKEEKLQTSVLQTSNATPPTKEEVAAYAAKISRPDLAEEFFDHYEERGWLHRGEPLADWKAMMKGWARKLSQNQPTTTRKQPMTAEASRYEQDASY